MAKTKDKAKTAGAEENAPSMSHADVCLGCERCELNVFHDPFADKRRKNEYCDVLVCGCMMLADVKTADTLSGKRLDAYRNDAEAIVRMDAMTDAVRNRIDRKWARDEMYGRDKSCSLLPEHQMVALINGEKNAAKKKD